MGNVKLKASYGSDFNTTCLQAKNEAIRLRNAELNFAIPTSNVEFEFNEITCVVSAKTDLSLLYRDYRNAHMMDWKTIGPDCQENYSPEIEKELKSREDALEKKHELQRQQAEIEDAAERKAFQELTKSIVLELKEGKDKEFAEQKSINQDGYGACIFEYAEGWAKLMQGRIATGESVKDIAEKTSFQMGFLGITGFMYGAAVSILSTYWKHGEDLRKWHNKEYGHEGDGVVNPAILSVN